MMLTKLGREGRTAVPEAFLSQKPPGSNYLIWEVKEEEATVRFLKLENVQTKIGNH